MSFQLTPQDLANKYPDLPLYTPFRLWKMVFRDEIIKEIMFQTNLYARRDKNDRLLSATELELYQFIGIFLLSWYYSLPTEQCYWSNQPDLDIPIISEAMSSKQFEQIERMLYLVGNDAAKHRSNKMVKVAPLYNSLNNVCV